MRDTTKAIAVYAAAQITLITMGVYAATHEQIVLSIVAFIFAAAATAGGRNEDNGYIYMGPLWYIRGNEGRAVATSYDDEYNDEENE